MSQTWAGSGNTGLEKFTKGTWKTGVRDENLDLFIGDFYSSFQDFSGCKVSKTLAVKSVNWRESLFKVVGNLQVQGQSQNTKTACFTS